METVAVLMSSYNGEEYIREQIDSILAQENVLVRLFVRDDGSSDGTRDIVTEYGRKHDNVVLWNKDESRNLGVTRSFLTLLKEVLEQHPEIRYFAFSDQDDFWLPDKLSSAVERIAAAEKEKNGAFLYYSNKIYTDGALKTIKKDNIRFYGDYLEALELCMAQGCVQVFNRKMAALAVSVFPEYDCYHDAWVYRLAKMTDASVLFDPEPHILYRQHGENAFGLRTIESMQTKWSSVLKIFNIPKVIRDLKNKGNNHWTQNMIRELYRTHGEDFGEDQKKKTAWVLDYDRNFAHGLNLAFRCGALRRGPKKFLLWCWQLVTNNL